MRYGWQTWCVAHTGVARTFEQGDQSEGTGRGWEDFENCYFFQYFVGTSETLSVQMTGLHKLRKNIIGAVAPPPPPAPSGYANVERGGVVGCGFLLPRLPK